MKRGRVLGEVWGTRRAPGLDGHRLLLVGEATGDRVVVALDVLDARQGDEVLVAFGSGARNVVERGPDNRDVSCDAAIALIVDGSDDEGHEAEER